MSMSASRRRRSGGRLALLTVLIGAAAAAGLGASCVKMPGQSHHGALPAATAEQATIRTNLERHVRALAGGDGSVGIGERNVDRRPQALDEASAYVDIAFREAGYTVRRQPFTADGREVANLVAEKRGKALPDEIVVVGAHYDTAYDTPGADDNASGVAVLLELARLLRDVPLDRTVQFVAFVNEEPPWFRGDQMGSRVHADALAAEGAKVAGMLSLETLGYYRTEPGTQHYPWPFALLYPDTADFVGFVGNLRSRQLVRRAVGAFREGEPFPSQGAALPGSVTGVDWSDHASYWHHGWPAVMVTDTAPFRNPHYHEPTDTPETLDLERASRVVTGLREVLVTLDETGW